MQREGGAFEAADFPGGDGASGSPACLDSGSECVNPTERLGDPPRDCLLYCGVLGAQLAVFIGVPPGRPLAFLHEFAPSLECPRFSRRPTGRWRTPGRPRLLRVRDPSPVEPSS